ncbi:MAG: biotin--[acetyl-CoA-carboxylase] ligase [Cyclobacteriaceae bacterium]|nr:MAG: biotin--[acetyl-CoA-carboxylase] ligase [Cyclobacteriaceae bacterium]
MASDLLSGGIVADGTVIVTNNQTAGKGQRGNKWESEPGQNLTLSAMVKPYFLPIAKQFDLTVITSLAIVHTLENFELTSARVKWPNDIYYHDDKIAGILIENTVRATQLEWAVLGIGLNVNQQQFKVGNATSISLVSGKELELQQVLNKLLVHLNRNYQKLKSGLQEELRDEYTQKLMWINQRRTFREKDNEESFNGMIVRVTESGKLVIQTKQTERSYDFKEIVFVG